MKKDRWHDRMHPLPTYYHSRLPVLTRSAGFSVWQGDKRVARETSDICGVELVVGGSAIFAQNGKEFNLPPGQIYVLQPVGSHLYRTGEEGFLLKRQVVFGGEALERLWQMLGLASCDTIVAADPRKITRLISHLSYLLRKKPLGYVQASSVATYALLLALSRDAVTTMPGLVQKAVDYANRNLHQTELSGALLAKRLHVSLPHFNRLFRAHMRCSPGTYIQTQRLDLAKMLLRDTEQSISSIATNCGYSDPLYFSTRFRHVCGASPRSWRQQAVSIAASDKE